MNLLAPLGLLALVGTLVLVLIYLIKPNYQQKFVSSTYIWKLSLKYKKKRVPVSPLRNVLIFLCQLFALAAFGLLVATPVIRQMTTTPKNEKIAVIDASASMLVKTTDGSRFERAVAEVATLAEATLAEEGGAISVIVADSEAYVLVSRATSENLTELKTKLASLTEDELKCGFGSADLNGAASLAEDILKQNSESQVLLYTATDYIDKGDFTVVNVASEDDFNVAVLGCQPTLSETNAYSFTVDVGCYGRTKPVEVTCEIYGVNKKRDKDGAVTDPGKSLIAKKTEYFSELSPTKTMIFSVEDFPDANGEPILSYEYMYVHVDEADGFEKDNSYNVYGGEKTILRIQYASSQPNNFFSGILRTLRQSKKGSFNIEIQEVAPAAAKTEGFDLYIYEHKMPEEMPTDGVVMLVDPDKAPEGSGLRFGDLVSVNSSSTLASGTSHPLTSGVNPDRITVAEYRKVLSSDGYDELLYYHGDPVMLSKNDDGKKVIVLALNLNKSSLGVVVDFPVLLYNIFEYYLPATLTRNECEVGGTVLLNPRGTDATFDGPGYAKLPLSELPASYRLTLPGDYTVTQTDMRGNTEIDQIFVHVPASESDITKQVDSLPGLHTETTMVESDIDLLFWIALFALACLFLEWWLHSRERN